MSHFIFKNNSFHFSFSQLKQFLLLILRYVFILTFLESKNRRKVISSDDDSDEEWRKSKSEDKSKKRDKKTPSKAHRRFADSSSGKSIFVSRQF